MAGLIVHEWLEPRGGAEVVVENLLRAFPDARLIALWNDDPARFSNDRVSETALRHAPHRGRKPLSVVVSPLIWRNVRSNDDDWILASSHLFAHHAHSRPGRASKEPRKFVYAYTPARYIWEPELDARARSWGARALSPSLRALDRRRAQEAFAIAGISKFVAERIERCWHRGARVIYPPVYVSEILSEAATRESLLSDSELAFLQSLPDQFVLGASRFVPYKRLDIVIAAAQGLGLPVVIAGAGPLEADLRMRLEQAGVPGHLSVAPSNALLRALYARATVYIFPPVEDFGIMPVEAMATGTPVVVNTRGGAAEIVAAGGGGMAVGMEQVVNVVAAARAAMSIPSATSIENAKLFDSALFRQEIRNFVDSDTRSL